MRRFTGLASFGALVLALATGCGGESAGGAPSGSAQGAGGNGTGPTSGGPGATTGSTGSGGSVNPTGDSVTLTLEPFDTQSGTERQVCKTINLPVDAAIDVVQIHSKMEGTSHHFNLYKVLGANATAPVTAEESTVHDCSPANEQLSGDAAYIYGSATPEKTFDTPPNVAFNLQPGHRLILEQHVINTTGGVIQGGVTVDLRRAAADAKIEHHADVIWFANWGFLISANQESDATTHCTVPYNVEVFGLSSHTHKLGVHFAIEKWTTGGTEHLYDSTDWAHPLYEPQDPPLALASGEGLQWTCTWKNTTSGLVLPGKNSTDEMCITFAAAYPKDSLEADPIQCNNMGF